MNATALSAHRENGRGASQRVLDHYASHSPFSTPGRHAALLDALPFDPASVARTVQGLLIYEHVAELFYGYPIPDARRAESHIRPIEQFIDALLELDDRPLHIGRPSEKRLVGICRHFMLLSLAIFRHHGVPARGRGGFGAYFNPGKFEDHWVCEYWKAEECRWALLDSQFDDVFVRNLAIHHDVLDVPRAQFLTASEAWRRCRGGELNPNLFGIEFSQLRGLWFIAGSLIRDLATLNGQEILPWDVWGVQPAPDATLSDEELDFFDEIALLTADPDANFDALKQRFAEDVRVRVPAKVFNALRQREERVFEG
ncbi:hypothetical protein DEV91_13330 [Phyllobacterium brassicacearum]|uniref:transglutaminase domain-containing protein n=1 Tax=Phyllobacterium brassicacearum TaxID=314235 RepID=UPI0010620B03|nr:transglutaminase domain-containing protein [Phyllobacterium brassicacearum]TDQ16199.1 hypothetical protein DEV91_13330 [Phyllobacterium brassicacearum]